MKLNKSQSFINSVVLKTVLWLMGIRTMTHTLLVYPYVNSGASFTFGKC